MWTSAGTTTNEYDTRPADRRSLALGWVRARRERSQSLYDRSQPFVSLAPARRIILCEVARPGARNKFNLLDEEEDGDVLRGNFRCAGGGVRGNGV